MIKFLPFLAILGLAFGLPRGLLEERIAGGSVATIEQFPYLVSVQYYDQHICGGSILTPQRILTAAHCTFGQNASAFSIRAGSSFHASGGQKIKVSRIGQHLDYNPATHDKDIAVLALAKAIALSPSAQPIQTATLPVDAGTMATVTGWGSLSEGGPISSQLYQVRVPTIYDFECKKAYEGHRITSDMICAGVDAGGIGPCQGDSGSPLVNDVGLGLQIGIASWGVGCAAPGKPGVYTYIPHFELWLFDHTL